MSSYARIKPRCHHDNAIALFHELTSESLREYLDATSMRCIKR